MAIKKNDVDLALKIINSGVDVNAAKVYDYTLSPLPDERPAVYPEGVIYCKKMEIVLSLSL